MKNVITLTLISFLFLSCNRFQNLETNLKIDKYIALEYGSFDNNGELIHFVLPIILQNSDSIGQNTNLYSRRVSYLLTNRINIDTLNKLMPDSTAIDLIFNKEISEKYFIESFKKIALPNNQPKEEFTENEMMSIASKFFLVEELSENSFGTRICSGINGIENSKKDYLLLEAVIFDAIFSRIMKNDKPKAKFMDNLVKYQDSVIKTTKNIDSKTRLREIRNEIYSIMEDDINLRNYLIEYFKTNQKNIPIKLKE